MTYIYGCLLIIQNNNLLIQQPKSTRSSPLQTFMADFIISMGVQDKQEPCIKLNQEQVPTSSQINQNRRFYRSNSTTPSHITHLPLNHKTQNL